MLSLHSFLLEALMGKDVTLMAGAAFLDLREELTGTQRAEQPDLESLTTPWTRFTDPETPCLRFLGKGNTKYSPATSLDHNFRRVAIS